MTIKAPTHDFDSPWKELTKRYLPQLLLLLFPIIYSEIDWARGFTFLDKELQKIAPNSRSRRRIVDVLARVYLKDGSETLILLHIEIQAQKDEEFTVRMYRYNHRIFDYTDLQSGEPGDSGRPRPGLEARPPRVQRVGV